MGCLVGGWDGYPVWSHDGEQIAFVWRVSDEKADIHVRRVGGQRSLLRLTQGVGTDLYPVWSPEGNEVAFYRSAGEQSGTFTVEALGGQERFSPMRPT